MPDLDKLEEMPRKELHVFYVLDTSGSMAGEPIAQLNRAMRETTEALKELAKDNADAKLKMVVMEFNSNCKWVTNGPESLEGDFYWSDLSAGGGTEVGAALRELNKKLSRKAYLNSVTGALMPVIIFMTDGFPTDDYDRALAEIRQNKWFSRAAKIGFAIGEGADVKMVASIVGDHEAVIQTSDMEVFKRLMKFASIHSSMLASTSSTTDNTKTGGAVVKAATQQVSGASNITPNLDKSQYNPQPQPTNNDPSFESDGWD